MEGENVDVAVLGAGGATGRALIPALLRRGLRVRVLLHRPAPAETFSARVQSGVAELGDAGSLAAGLRGARAVHYIPPTYNTAEERFGANVIAAALEAGVSRMSYHSVLHAPTPAMTHHIRKSRVELMLRESPLAWTIVQPAMYAQTPLAFLDPERTLLSPGFDVTRPFTPVDVADLGEAVAAVLAEAGHAFATYELAGAERLTFEDMAAALGRVVGHGVTARAAPPDAVLATAGARGFPASALEELGLMMAHYDRHGLVGNPNVLRMLLGREPTGFEAAVARTLKPQLQSADAAPAA